MNFVVQMKCVFAGGSQAGQIGLLTLPALGWDVECVISYDRGMDILAGELRIPVRHSYKETLPYRSDLQVSVNAKEVLSQEFLDRFPLGGVNVHPCLYLCPGRNPVERFVDMNLDMASVGIHRMTAEVDVGEVLCELKIDIRGERDPERIYNKLYQFYPIVMARGLDKL